MALTALEMCVKVPVKAVQYTGLSMQTVPGGSVDFLGMLSLERLGSVEFLDWLLVRGWQCRSVSE